MKTVRIGLIGFGFMGTTHFGVYKGLKNAQVVALADLDPAKRNYPTITFTAGQELLMYSK